MQLTTNGSANGAALTVDGAVYADSLYVNGSLILAGNSVTGANSVGFGTGNNVVSENAAAFGLDNYISGNNAVAIGYASQAYMANSLAVGDRSYTAGDNAISMGSLSAATGQTSLAIGTVAHAYATSAIALGVSAEATGAYSIAIGAGTKATNTGSMAFGWTTTANGNAATALGVETIANADHQTVVGVWNEPQGLGGNPVLTDPLFIVGNGTSGAASDRSNALVVKRDGSMGVGERIYTTIPAQTVVGKYNDTSAEATPVYNHGDGLFIVGMGSGTVGSPDERKNALRVRKSDGVLLIQPSAGISMGGFTAGEKP